MQSVAFQATDKPCYKSNSSSICINLFVAFLLQERGAREKLAKENATKKISPPAGGEEAYAASTAPPFEKGGRKPLSGLTVRTALSAS